MNKKKVNAQSPITKEDQVRSVYTNKMVQKKTKKNSIDLSNNQRSPKNFNIEFQKRAV